MRRTRRAPRDVGRYNRAFYERLWRGATVVRLPGVEAPARPDGPRIELGCGLRPRLPLAGTIFVDASPRACAALRRAGATAVRADAAALPFRTASLGEAQLFDVIEHVADDAAVARELGRVLRQDGQLVVSTPLHSRLWQTYDRLVGHARRYDPDALARLLGDAGFEVAGIAPFGLRPRSALVARLGLFCRVRWPARALWYEERVLRFIARRTPPVRLGRVSTNDQLVRAASRLSGAVTAWRRTRVARPA